MMQFCQYSLYSIEMSIDIFRHALGLGMAGDARVDGLGEVARNLGTQLGGDRALIGWKGWKLAPGRGQLVDQRRGINIGLVELADERQAAVDIGWEVLGEVEVIGYGSLCIRIGAHVERFEGATRRQADSQSSLGRGGDGNVFDDRAARVGVTIRFHIHHHCVALKSSRGGTRGDVHGN